MSNKKMKDKFIVNAREIELLNKYYEVDNENRIVTMPLHYDKASDLVNGKIISKDNYLFDYEELTSINDMIKRIPVMYKIKINIDIDDYEDYEPEKLLSGFNDAMELNQFNYEREKKLKFLRASLLLIVGISVLFFVGYGKINHWFGTSQEADIYSEIFDIIGWVFIWETVTIAFLSGSELGVNSNMFKLRVLDVSFSNDNNVIVTENLQDISSKWHGEIKLEKASKWSLLISGVGFLAMSSISIIGSIPTSINSLMEIRGSSDGNGTALGITLMIFILFDVLISVLEILGAVAALAKYMGKRIFTRLSKVFFIFLLLLLAPILVYSFIIGSVGASYLVTLAIVLLYMFGYVSDYIIERRRNNASNIIENKTNEEE